MRALFTCVAILLTLYFVTACPGSGEREAAAEPVGRTATERASQQGETRGAKLDPATARTARFPHGAVPSGAEFNWLPTADGLYVASWFWGPKKPGAPAVILLHQRGKDKSSWGGMPAKLLAEDYCCIAIDLRGHGETVDAAGNRLALDKLKPADYTAMLNDVAAAHSFLASREDVDAEHVAIIGASIGANLGIIYTASDRNMRAAVALSPGLDYFGLKPAGALEAYSKRPLYLVAAVDDKESYDACLQIEKLAVLADPVYTRFYEKSNAHGTDLLMKQEGLADTIISGFLLNSMPPKR